MRLAAEQTKKLELVSLDLMRSEQVTKIGSQLPEKDKRELFNFLRKHAYANVFAWFHEDIPGIDPREFHIGWQLIQHLNLLNIRFLTRIGKQSR